MEYKFTDIEEKWKKIWNENNLYQVSEDNTKPKYYVLDMFPYPSGAGLHVGHPLGYVASDIFARYKRLKGYNVLHPMGYDAFGLPAEQYAIETGTHPAVTTGNAIARYREQMDKIGFSFDWSRQIKTCSPEYYKWTQWIFTQLFNSWYNREADKAEDISTLVKKLESGFRKSEIKNALGELTEWNKLNIKEQQNVLMQYRLVYLSFAEVNWCEALGCVLANDEVKDGKSERGGHPVEKRKMRQWFLRITEYSDRLLEGLDRLDWSEAMKEMQRNWIGRSEGAWIDFETGTQKLQVFTTRPDTIFGATFIVIAPEHHLVETLTTPAQKEAVEKYITYVKSRTDVERQQEKKVTGEFTGSYVVNPFTEKKIPVYLAEYVLAGYGTGAIMAVPADDERDKKFAEKFGLPVVDIIDKSMHPGATIEDKVGKMINSGFLNGLEVTDAITKMLNELEQRGIGERKVNYKQRDAIYSRQRYWGEPIPVKYKTIGEPDLPFGESNDEAAVLALDELPLVLPQVDSFKPTGDGRSPLANNSDWVNNGYETDTMPGYAGSSWYFLRYMDPKNPNEFASKEKLDYWQNVDIYFGGAEHAVGHLLYSRMWHKFLYDLGYVNTDEPFKKMVNQGMIQGVSALVKVQWNGKDDNSAAVISNGETTLAAEGTTSQIHFPINYLEYQNGKYILNKERLEKTKAEFPKFASYEISKQKVANNLLSDNEKRLQKIRTEDGVVEIDAVVEKMSKSKNNVVNPDDVIAEYGADCFRMYEMFLGPIEQSKPWDDKGISGVSNFLKKFWRLFYSDTGWQVTNDEASPDELKVLHKTIKKIADDIERLNFNTSVSAFMIATNELGTLKCHKRAILEPLLICLAPFAPFITEQLWSNLGNKRSVHLATYPSFEEKYLVESEHTYPVSINGKVRAEVKLSLEISAEEAEKQVLRMEKVQQWTKGNAPKKFIFIKGKIINVVV